MRRSVSRGCRPTEGSSRTYSVPTQPRAQRRWRGRSAAPRRPERVAKGAVEGQVVEAHVGQEAQAPLQLVDAPCAATVAPLALAGRGRQEGARLAHGEAADLVDARGPRPAPAAPRGAAGCRRRRGTPGSRGSGSGRPGPAPCTSSPPASGRSRGRPGTPRRPRGRARRWSSSRLGPRDVERDAAAAREALQLGEQALVVRPVPGLDGALAQASSTCRAPRAPGRPRSGCRSRGTVGQAPKGLLKENRRGCGLLERAAAACALEGARRSAGAARPPPAPRRARPPRRTPSPATPRRREPAASVARGQAVEHDHVGTGSPSAERGRRRPRASTATSPAEQPPDSRAAQAVERGRAAACPHRGSKGNATRHRAYPRAAPPGAPPDARRRCRGRPSVAAGRRRPCAPSGAKSRRRWSWISVAVATVERGLREGGALADGDRGADAVDRVQGRLLHPLEELPRVDGEALHVAPLPLGDTGCRRPGCSCRSPTRR